MKRLALIGLFGAAAAGAFGAAIMARALQNEMSKALSQTIVIINNPALPARSASSS